MPRKAGAAGGGSAFISTTPTLTGASCATAAAGGQGRSSRSHRGRPKWTRPRGRSHPTVC